MVVRTFRAVRLKREVLRAKSPLCLPPEVFPPDHLNTSPLTDSLSNLCFSYPTCVIKFFSIHVLNSLTDTGPLAQLRHSLYFHLLIPTIHAKISGNSILLQTGPQVSVFEYLGSKACLCFLETLHSMSQAY